MSSGRASGIEAFDLAGKVALVTGGNTGLGAEFAHGLAAAGADVHLASIVDDGGEFAGQLATDTSVRTLSTVVDLTADGAPERVVARSIEEFGRLDIVVNNAGINPIAPVLDFGREEWDPEVAVNLTIAFEISHQAAKVMIPQGSGKIINVCSVFSFLGGRGSPAYAATKHALVGLTRAYADELGSHGIQVNGIAPGYFATDLTAATKADQVASARIVDHIPAGRWGATHDLKGPLVFLASSASDYVNGHVLVVDGGYLVR